RPFSTTKASGYGIGAYQARELIRGMGGRLDVASVPGEGTQVVVRLTAAPAAIQRNAPPVVVLDLGLPPDPDGASEGLATLEGIVENAPQTKVIIASGNEQRENAVRAVALGA